MFNFFMNIGLMLLGVNLFLLRVKAPENVGTFEENIAGMDKRMQWN